MPSFARARLAVAIGAVLLATVLAFAWIVRAYGSADIAATHEQDEEADVARIGSTVARKIYTYKEAENWMLLTKPPPVAPSAPGPEVSRQLPPIATAALRAMVDSVSNAFVWVLDRNGVTIYANTGSVAGLSDVERSALDSIVATVEPKLGAFSVQDTNGLAYVQVGATGVGAVKTVKLSRGTILLAAVKSELQVQSVNRVVAGQFTTPAPAFSVTLGVPILLMLPLVIVAAVAAGRLVEMLAVQPVDERIASIIHELEAITDGRSLHRRLADDPHDDARLQALTETLNAMIGRLDTSFSALRRFTADASHELKTPLTVMRADIERAMAVPSNRGEQFVALEEALAETTRMADLVNSLLTLARADEGRFDLHGEPVDLQALAKDVYETALLLGEPSGITVKMPPPPALYVTGDRDRLRQLFLNLITNAIKYTSRGGQVELTLERADASARFSVRDTGIGIAAADLPHVFDRFWRADRARSRVGERAGVGLGLAISQYIAHAHGGAITVQSRLGRGTTFTVTLPTSAAAQGKTDA